MVRPSDVPIQNESTGFFSTSGNTKEQSTSGPDKNGWAAVAGLADSLFGGLFGLGSTLVNTTAQQQTNANNLLYQQIRDIIADQRYNDETSYNRAAFENQREYERSFAQEEQQYNREFAENERDYQRAFAENQREYERAFTAEEQAYNRAFAENERDYNRALTERLFEREDTALERQAESLSRMGINPLSQNLNGLGAGNIISSSAPSSSSAPNGGYGGSASPNSSKGANTPLPAMAGQYAKGLHEEMINRDFLTPILEMVNTLGSLHTQGINRDILRQQANSLKLDNLAKAKKLGAKIVNGEYSIPDFNHTEQEFSDLDYKDKKASADRNERENQFQEKMHVTDKTSPTVRMGADLAEQIITSSEKAREDGYEPNMPKRVGKVIRNSYNAVANSLKSTVNKFYNWVKRNTNSSKEFEKKYRRR